MEVFLDSMQLSVWSRGVSDTSLVKKYLFKVLYLCIDTPSLLLADLSAPYGKQWRYFIKCLSKGH